MALYRDTFGYADLPAGDTFVAEPDDAPSEVTLRLPPRLKSSVDKAAKRDGVPSDSWLLLAIASVAGSEPAKAA